MTYYPSLRFWIDSFSFFFSFHHTIFPTIFTTLIYTHVQHRIVVHEPGCTDSCLFHRAMKSLLPSPTPPPSSLLRHDTRKKILYSFIRVLSAHGNYFKGYRFPGGGRGGVLTRMDRGFPLHPSPDFLDDRWMLSKKNMFSQTYPSTGISEKRQVHSKINKK